MQLDWLTFTLEIVNFLVLVWILQRFLYRPVLAAIARRKAAIEKTLAEAGTRKAEAQALERQYRDRLTDWEKEKAALRAAALEAVAAERAQRMAALERALGEEREKRAAAEAHRAAEEARRLEREAAEHGAQFAARLLGRVADAALEHRLVAAALEDLAQLPPERLEALRSACRDAGGRAQAASAFGLPAPQREALARALSAAAGAEVRLEFREDPRLLAGLRVGLGPLALDANLQTELKFFAEAAAHAG